MPVHATRADLATHLRSYGEEELAGRLDEAPDEELERIFDRADHYLHSDEHATPSGASPLIAKALALAAVEVLEGAQRELRRKRRRLKGVVTDADRSPADPESERRGLLATVVRRLGRDPGRTPPPRRSVASGDLIAEVMTCARAELTAVGWRKRGGDIYTRELSPDALGWLGLNRAVSKRGGAMDVNPVVGMRHQGVHRLLAELRDERFHQYIPPTVSVHVGHVMPERGYRRWRFEEGGPLEAHVRDLVESVERHGVPFMTGLLEPDALLAALDEHPLHREYHRPAFLVLQGRADEARRFVRSHVLSIAERDDPAADEYRAFAERVLALERPGSD